MLAVAVHKNNVHLELSAGYPNNFSENLIKFTNSILQDKVMFGSGYPLFEPEEWLRQFEKLSLSSQVQEKVILKNASKFFSIKV